MCGARALLPVAEQTSVIFAVSDVLVYKVLEALGKRIVREQRGRFNELAGRPWHIAHTLWQPSQVMVERTFRGAWDIIPALLDSHGDKRVSARELEAMLTAYAGGLARTGLAHTKERLAHEFHVVLGLAVIVGDDHDPD